MSCIQDAKKIMQKLIDNGYEAYIVGGYVRDFLLKKETSDIDIATNALPDAVKSLFPKTIPTGLKHGTVTVIFNSVQYEITTFRTDSVYINNRKPENVTFVSSLEEDVKRRDFTMNALAFTIDEHIIDYVNGQLDIQNKIIKTVGNPYERFSEDALRMLRAFRFVSKLGFKIEEDTLLAISKNAFLIQNISLERILAEFENMISGAYFLDAIELFIQTSFNPYLSSFNKGIESINKTKISPTDIFEFLCICAVSGNYSEVIKLPISNQIKKEMRIVHEMYTLEITEFTKPLIFRNGLRNCLLTNQLNTYLRNTLDKKEEILIAYQSMSIHKQCDLKFKGDEILSLYEKKPGPWVSEILDEICLKVLIGELENNEEKIKNYLLSK